MSPPFSDLMDSMWLFAIGRVLEVIMAAALHLLGGGLNAKWTRK